MKGIERFLIAFCVIGTLARLFVRPYDPLLQVIGFCGLALWYAVAYFFLLAGVARSRWRSAGIRPPEALMGVAGGLVSGYAVLSMLLHWLGWTHWVDTLGLAGGALAALAVIAWLLRRRAADFYRRLLLRLVLTSLLLVAVLLLRPLLFPGRVLNYLNPA